MRAPALRSAATDDAFSDIRKRTARRFARAVLFRPDDESTEHPDISLAPLIVQEVTEQSEAHTPLRFGALLCAPDGRVAVDPSQPTVYYRIEPVELRGKQQLSMIYQWYFAPVQPRKEHPTAVAVRGVFGDNGFPLLWEVVQARNPTQQTPPRIFFVSASLEEEAKAKFGGAKPGRAFALEPGLGDAPSTVVAGVLEEGPMPLGPYVYLARKPPAVSTLLCRCSAAQMDKVIETVPYELVPFDAVRSLAAEIWNVPAGTDESPVVHPSDLAGDPGHHPPVDPLLDRLQLPLDAALRWP